MEDVLTLLVVVVSFFVWIAQNVAQAKKRASQEFDQALDEIEDGEEDLSESKIPPPHPIPAAPLPKPVHPAPQGAPTWKELQKQLEQVLGQPPTQPSSQRTEPARVPRRPGFPRQQPEPPASRSFEKPIPAMGTKPGPRPSDRPVYRPQPAPSPVPQLPPRPAVLARSVTSREAPPRIAPAPTAAPGAKSQGRGWREIALSDAQGRPLHGKFPNLHPDPIANAVILAEILKPYSGGPVGWRGR